MRDLNNTSYICNDVMEVVVLTSFISLDVPV